jgi:hypothetical protein
MEARIIFMLASILVAALADFVDPAFAQHAADLAAGADYAKKFCTKCHALNRGEASPEPTRHLLVATPPATIAGVMTARPARRSFCLRTCNIISSCTAIYSVQRSTG